MSTAILSAEIRPPSATPPATLETLFPKPRVHVPISWPHLLANVPASIATPQLKKRIAEAEKVLASGLKVVTANSSVTRYHEKRAAELAYSTDPSEANLHTLTTTTALSSPSVCDSAQRAGYVSMQANWVKHVAPLVVEIFPKLISNLESRREEVRLTVEKSAQAYGASDDAGRLPILIITKAIEILQQDITRAQSYLNGRDVGGTQNDLHSVPDALALLAR